MRSSIVFFALAASSTASAGCAEPPEGSWRAPIAGEVRSPCPMLNVLANHGYLPRNGKNISREITRNAMSHGLQLDEGFADIMFDPAITTNPNPNSTTFDLDHLNRHNILEHDGSLSRADAYWDDSQVFNQTVYEETLSYFTGDTINIKSAAAARMARVMSSMRTNPTFVLNTSAAIISVGETAAYILALGDKVAGTVPLERVRLMFEEEKLPFQFGWTNVGSVPATASDLFNLTQRVIDSTEVPEVKARMYGGIHGGIVAKLSK